jgi:Schlafen group 3, DNA/RNA helicase domain
VEVAAQNVIPKTASLRFWYGAPIPEFLDESVDSILGKLAFNCDFALIPTQRDASFAQIEFLRSQLKDLAGSIFFEFNIPRMGRRIDVVVIIGPLIFAIEFKVGEKTFDRPAIDQVWDYGLDLKNFHEASHDASIIPILIATEATACPPVELQPDPDKLYRPVVVDPQSFRGVLEKALAKVSGTPVDADAWARASYHPTPTIVEAARALYAQHSVEAIARFDAGAQNLHVTSRRIEELVDEAQAKGRKRICFVTGVPGAGKTLVGLNLATRREIDQPTHAVFLSGNGPLVAVLREALTRDEVERRKKQGGKGAERKSWRKRKGVHSKRSSLS